MDCLFDTMLKSFEIMISLLTLILTPLISALLVYYQLKKSQFYWKKQQKIINDRETNRLRINIYREIVELINELNDSILHHHIYASNRDISMALSILLKTISSKDADFFENQFEIQKINAENSYLKMRQLSIKFSGMGVNIKVFFDSELFELFLVLQNKIKEAQKPVMSKEDVANRLKEMINEQNNWIVSKENFTKQYDALMENQRPISETNLFLTEIMKRFERIEK